MRKLSLFNGGVVQSVYDGTGERHRQDGNTAVSPEKKMPDMKVVSFIWGPEPGRQPLR